MTDHHPSPSPSSTPHQDTVLARLDAWMAASPWHPRIVPLFVFVGFLLLNSIVVGGDWGVPATPVAYLPIYLLTCAALLFVLVRYRRLTPELNWKFHWLAVPTGLGLLVAWIALGYAYNLIVEGGLEIQESHDTFAQLYEASPALYWASVIVRLLGMSILVPMLEELFTRSAALRGLSDARKTGIGVIQLLSDLPMIGDWLTHTSWGKRAGIRRGMFTEQFESTPVGKLTYFGVFISTLIFMLNHNPRDWAGCIACGLVWCALLGWTNRPALPEHKRLGLGPIIWSHGITNAALWAWSVFGHYLPPNLGFGGDWQFL